MSWRTWWPLLLFAGLALIASGTFALPRAWPLVLVMLAVEVIVSVAVWLYRRAR